MRKCVIIINSIARHRSTTKNKNYSRLTQSELHEVRSHGRYPGKFTIQISHNLR